MYKPFKTYMGSVFILGMLLLDDIVFLRPSVMVNIAFMFGSSKHGNERRASGAENCVTAKYLNYSQGAI
jgi:ABC-type uncharacterized transport system YnjBCD ATPase subunit